jgi:O-acetyl-ADP-ribose deacetylase (regulator of RNase III)
MEGLQLNRSTVQLVKDDITDLEIDAFVFYAQHDLALGSGFGGAIAVRGGQSVQKELEELGTLATGEVVVTDAGGLKAQYIIHAVGPRFQEEDIENKLSTTVLNSLELADEKGIERIAFPAMGAGYYGIPNDVCARVMMGVIADHLKGETGIKELVICVLDTGQYDAFKAAIAALH